MVPLLMALRVGINTSVGRGLGVLCASVLLCLGLGCQQMPSSQSTATPVMVEVTPRADVVSETPGIVGELALDQVRALYEAPVSKLDNGFLSVEPLLNREPSITEVSLDTLEQIAEFDKSVLPILKDGFNKPLFVPPRVLGVGEQQIDYRALRHLVGLLSNRAEQLWADGEREEALDLIVLPLKLSKAMRGRPETASVNLFSAWYAESSLRVLAGWLGDSCTAAELAKLSTALAENSPDYAHTKQTVEIDFAKLLTALDTEEGRQHLGIGTLEPATLTQWKQQLRGVFAEAQRLYDIESVDPAVFNKSVMSAATPIQGLVIDYPEVSTMQKRSYALYKSTEIGLATMGPSRKSLIGLASDDIIAAHFKDDPKAVEVLKRLVTVELTEKTVRVLGKPGPFELLAPGVEPVFFEHHSEMGPTKTGSASTTAP